MSRKRWSGNTPRPSGESAMPRAGRRCAGMFVMSWSMKNTEPAAAGASPAMVLSVELLPAPLAPMIATTVPGLTSMEIERSAETGP